MPRRFHQPRAFTLLELVLVMVIIATALAMAAPSLRGWSRASELRDAGEQVYALTRYARTQAAANCTVYRLNIDSAAGRYWLTQRQGTDFTPIASDFGQVFSLASGLKIELEKQAVHTDVTARRGAGFAADDAAPLQPAQYVDFFPAGYTEAAVIRVTSERGGTMTIQSPSPAEGFRIVRQQGGAA